MEGSSLRYNKKNMLQKVDHISSLPDSILIHILSCLPTTKDAIKTGILSRRWLYLWTHLPTLIFKFRVKSGKAPPFVRPGDMDKTLLFITSSEIKKFQFSLDDYILDKLPQLGPRIDIWIRFTVLRRVEELILEFNPGPDIPFSSGYLLPHFFYSNLCLIKLKTKFCRFVPNGKVIKWTSLKALDISCSTLSKETIDNIFYGSPLLESLRLSKCVGIQNLDIKSKTLKTLVLDDLKLDLELREYSTFVVTAPFLENLEILGRGYFKWKLRNVSSLIRASLDFCVMEEGELDPEDAEIGYQEICRIVVIDLLYKVRYVEELKCGGWFIQVVSALEKRQLPLPVLNCNLLALVMPDIDKWIIPGMASLFQSSHKIERLTIDFLWTNDECFEIDQDVCNLEFEWSYWRCHMRNFVFSHLKTIEFFGLSATSRERGLLYEFVEFLLKNTLMLQKMIIHRHGVWWTEEVLLLVDKLLSFPRFSPDAVIIQRNTL